MESAFDKTKLKHLILEYVLDNPSVRRKEHKEKERILFDLKSKYGDMFVKSDVEKIYDEVIQELANQRMKDEY